MNRFFFVPIICIAINVSAQEKAGWLRSNDISPDGSTIVFSYKGDIYTVGVEGGEARQITSSTAYESNPRWSRDGKHIVFSSYREGSQDIFVTSDKGGVPSRLTSYQGNEQALATTSDGAVLFTANILPDTQYSRYPGNDQLYKVDINGGKPELVTSLTLSNLSVNKDGVILFEDYKGVEDDMRKHHTSSVTRDIWMLKDNSYTKLSAFIGEDRNPVWAPDADTFYYLSEQGGNFNVWRSSISNPDTCTQVTDLPVHPVRYLSIADNGTMVFSYNGDLYRMKDGTEPVKLEITVLRDENGKVKTRRSINSGVNGIAVSSNGKDVAIEARGDIFMTTVDFKSTRRITNTSEAERGVTFSADGRELYYCAERNGHWGIWKSYMTDKDDDYFTFTFDFKEELVSDPDSDCMYPSVSPDGKSLAYFKDRTEIVVRDIRSGKERTVLSGALYSYQDGDLSFEWSPDSRFILCNYEAGGGWNNPDVALIELESGKVTNLTQSGYNDHSFRWALGGKAMTWMSDKSGYRSHGSWGSDDDVYIMFFDGVEYYNFTRDAQQEGIDKLLSGDDKKKEKKDSTETDKKKIKDLVLDLDNIEDRIIKLTPLSGSLSDYILSPDGSKLYYLQRLEKSIDLCQLDTRSKSVKVIQKGVSGTIYPDPDDKHFFLVSSLSFKRYDYASGGSKAITFSDEYDYFPAREREYMLNHAWKLVKDKFYDKTIHGIDWDGFRDNYLALLPYVDNSFDFRELLSEFLGELNASHTGGVLRTMASASTGRLGVFYDDTFEGPGLKVKEVMPGSCLSVAYPELKAGDVILAVDGKKIEPLTSWYDALDRKSGVSVLITLDTGRKIEDFYVKTASSDSELLYRRWVRSREKLVEELSGGRLGYVHVKGMDSESFREVFSKALGRYRNCEALVVDIRHNTGGWLHDDLASFLNGKAYMDFIPRGQYIGTEPYNKWNKPSCVVMCEDNYSDASGFPYIYQKLGIGKLVGTSVPGTMTAVWWENLLDPTLTIGVPEVTSVSRFDGSILEGQQIEPDIYVENTPESLVEGRDLQIEAAVRELLDQLGD